MMNGAPWPVEGHFHTYFRYGDCWFQVIVDPDDGGGTERTACVYPVTDEAVASWTAEQFQHAAQETDPE